MVHEGIDSPEENPLSLPSVVDGAWTRFCEVNVISLLVPSVDLPAQRGAGWWSDGPDPELLLAYAVTTPWPCLPSASPSPKRLIIPRAGALVLRWVCCQALGPRGGMSTSALLSKLPRRHTRIRIRGCSSASLPASGRCCGSARRPSTCSTACALRSCTS